MADQGVEGLLSPFLRRKRVDAAKPYLLGHILDIGCGSGALAALVPADHYIGVEMDAISLRQAQLRFPSHRFASILPESPDLLFDTIILLAVIEHVSDPGRFLGTLTTHLSESATACIVVTTPHPSVKWVHDIGTAFGLFSKHANEEHDVLLDRSRLEMVGIQAALKLVKYRRFLFGTNQIAIFKKDR